MNRRAYSLFLVLASCVGICLFGAASCGDRGSPESGTPESGLASSQGPAVAAPIASPGSLLVGQPTDLMVTSQVMSGTTNPVISTGVNLVRVDAAGRVIATLGTMRDDGTNGDTVAGDGIFSLALRLQEGATGSVRLRVSAAFRGLLRRVLSDVAIVPVVTLPSPTATGTPTVTPTETPVPTPTETSSSATPTPSPVCGDGIVNQTTEQCDGADDSSCPGSCRADCACPVCDEARLLEVEAAAGKFISCYAAAVESGTPRLSQCSATLPYELQGVHGNFAQTECTWTATDDQYFLSLLATVQGLGDAALAALVNSPTPSICAAQKLLSVGRRTGDVLKTYASTLGGHGRAEFVASAAALQQLIAEDFANAENGNTDCQTSRDASALATLAESYLSKLLSLENRCETIPAVEFSQLAFGSWLDILSYAQAEGYSVDGPATVCPGRELLLRGARVRAAGAPLLHASTGTRASLVVGPGDGEAFIVQPESDSTVSLLGPAGAVQVAPDGSVMPPLPALTAAGTGAGVQDCAAWFDECRRHFVHHTLLSVTASELFFRFVVPSVAFRLLFFTADVSLYLAGLSACALARPTCVLPGGPNFCSSASAHCAGFSCVPDQATNEGRICGARVCLAGLAQDAVVGEARCRASSCRYELVEDCSLSMQHCEGSPAACVPGPASTPPPSDCTSAQTVVGLPRGSVTSISVGRFHSCVVTRAGEVKCWGRNAGGQLGDGTTTDSSVPVTALPAGAVKVAAGGGHTCALMNGGTVKCWGVNHNGQLGNGTLTDSTVPVDVLGNLFDAIDIAAGNHHTCAITARREVRCWGGNAVNQLGGICSRTSCDDRFCDTNAGICGSSCCLPGPSIGTAGGTFTPVTAVSLGRSHTCISGGFAGGGPITAFCWGFNRHGRLGRGNNVSRCTNIGECSAAPVCTDPLCGGRLVDALGLTSGGWDHTCAVESDNEVTCWGLNISGQIGDGTRADAQWATVGTGIKIYGPGDLSDHLALGQSHTCALTPFDVVCWGDNTFGQLGNGAIASLSTTPVAVSALSPVPIPSAISSGGGQHTCAIKGPLVECWGDNTFGQLGNGRFGCGDLLARYAPLLKYHPEERFFAVSAAAITDYWDNRLVDGSGMTIASPNAPPPNNLTLDFLNDSYPTGQDAMETDKLDISGTSTADYEMQAALFHAHPSYRNRIYGRVLDQRPVGGIWLQYWAFYYFNPGAFGVGDHEGDWEGVQVRLNDNLQVDGVLFLQHGSGAWCTSDQVELAGTHPVVYVAQNSHASYPRSGSYCRWPLPHADDATGGGLEVVPTVSVISEDSPGWVRWPGRWGSSGDSPQGPAFQGEKWDNPEAFRSTASNCNVPC